MGLTVCSLDAKQTNIYKITNDSSKNKTIQLSHPSDTDYPTDNSVTLKWIIILQRENLHCVKKCKLTVNIR